MSSVIFLFLVCLLLLTTSTYTQLPYCYAEPVRSMTDQKRHVHAGGGTGHHADGRVRLLSPGTGRGDQEPQKSELSLIEWPCPCFRNARSLCASVDRPPRRRPCHLAQQRLECAHFVNCGGNSFASHQLHFLCF